MGIERSEVYDKVCVTKFCMFFTTPGAITNLWLFGGLKNYFKEKIPPGFLAYNRQNMENFESCTITGSMLVDITS